jgi:aldehyde dehydrogenase (NAD+)
MNNQFQIASMQRFFQTGATRGIDFRAAQLRALDAAINAHATALHAALQADLHKSPAEAFAAETGWVQRDIRHALANLPRWSRPRRVAVPPGLFPALAHVVPEPQGVVLILGPWNYPVQLLLSPLVAALAAGNCAVLKPSEAAPQTSAALRDLIAATFDPDVVRLVEGGPAAAEALLREPFDHLFFTGGAQIGRRVAAVAAQRLVPATLELGGKSPAYVGPDADPALAARRIARGKFMNAGQTCVAPDHVWVHRPLQSAFLAALQTALHRFYGDTPQTSPDYGRIINRHHFDRLVRLCPNSLRDEGSLYIAPTVVSDPPLASPVMQEEIFGPILPVLGCDSPEEMIQFCRTQPAPLALYLFTGNALLRQRLMEAIPSGGVCINDTVQQLLPTELPFGGRGGSGLGAYHGKAGFDAFSHQRSLLVRSPGFDCPAIYPPFTWPPALFKAAVRLFSGH